MAIATPQATLGDLAQGAIAKYLKQATAYETAVLTDSDPENLHQMRVGLRRLRTAIQVFEAAADLPKPGREPKVAKVGRKLGKLRDLDVIHATLRDRYAPDLPDHEQFWLAMVLDHLYKKRQKAFKRTKRLLNGKRYQKMTRSLKQWVQEPEYYPLAQQAAIGAIPDLLLPLVCRLWLHPGWLVGTKNTRGHLKPNGRLTLSATDQLIAEEGTQLHHLRKQVKRVRYQLRLISDLYGDALEADIQRFSAMQDTLGALQDSTVLEDFVAAAVPDARAHLPTLFALLADSRHQAWKQWQTHQQYYLDPQNRQALRLALLQLPPSFSDAPVQTEQGETMAPTNGAGTKDRDKASRRKASTRKASSRKTSTRKTGSPKASRRRSPKQAPE
jgi:CHAD domain-containing protein